MFFPFKVAIGGLFRVVAAASGGAGFQTVSYALILGIYVFIGSSKKKSPLQSLDEKLIDIYTEENERDY